MIDVIEAWFDQSHRKENYECERELNVCFKIHDCPWRIVNGEALLVNSEYLTEEVSARLLRLFNNDWSYAELSEFHDAIMLLQSGDFDHAIAQATNSVKHLIKYALELQRDYSLEELLSRLINSGMIPHYYKEFLETFEKLVHGASQKGNLPGMDRNSDQSQSHNSRNLAEFIINLSGSINLFIIQSVLKLTSDRDLDEPATDLLSTLSLPKVPRT